jgi:hypothetical protein
VQRELVSVISDGQAVRGGSARPIRGSGGRSEVVLVPISELRPGESPRLNGQDEAHIARLVQLEAPLPPILVDRRSRKVIDGMHRLIAASLKGQETVAVRYFDGRAEDAFLWAVKENVEHGLPLPLADRRAAAARIVVSHPELSDRALAKWVGLAARTVASIRRRVSEDGAPTSGVRVGRDGKVRPLNGAEGRHRVAALVAEDPDASLRELARRAGVSPATVRDVRHRLARGEPPAGGGAVSSGPAPRPVDDTGIPAQTPARPARLREAPATPPVAPDPVVGAAEFSALEKLLRDPSLRGSEAGRSLLRLLQHNAATAQEWPSVLTALPLHCLVTVEELARQYGEMWLNFAKELDDRARIADPWASGS